MGRGSHWILNLPPNTTGVITDGFVRAVSQVGDAVRASFDVDVGKSPSPVTAKCSDVEVIAEATGSFDAIMVTEDLTHGQAVLGYTIELQDPHTKAWTAVSVDPSQGGQTIGSKGIVVLKSPQSASAARLRCTRAIDAVDSATGVTITSFSLHKLAPPPSA